jgi:hypothetical protein
MWGSSMSDDVTSTLTVAKLKALCILNDLSTTGKKSELVARLLESGLSQEDVGLPKAKAVEAKQEPQPDTTAEPEEVVLSMEDEDTLTPEVEPVKEIVEPSEPEDEVLEAEIIDADLILDEALVKKMKTAVPPHKVTEKIQPATLLDIVKRPQVAAALMTLIILGAGGYYYLNNQLEPFTADQLRYGDEMRYTVKDGTFLASDGYVELALEQLATDDEICKISMLFEGDGRLSITNGGTDQLYAEGSTDRLGAVIAKGGMGGQWLAVESINSNTLDTFTVQRHLTNAFNGCSSTYIRADGTAQIETKQYTELREQASLSTQADWEIDLPDPIGQYRGTTASYGVGGLLGGIESLAPGFAMMLQPIEVEDLLGNSLIDTGAAGANKGWEWRVVGIDEFAGTPAWKIIATHQDIRTYCLGSATMELWIEEGNPWAAKQKVDVIISSSQTSQADCSATTQLLNDLVLPEGELELHHVFERTLIERGQKQLDLGRSYNSRPQANQLQIDDDELTSWGANDLHMPDNSDMRTHTFEQAIRCFDFFQNTSGASSALDDNGYIWRATGGDAPQGSVWNMSWVATDGQAGWVDFNLNGVPAESTCEVNAQGAYEDNVAFNREAIPSTLNLSQMEQRLADTTLYGQLTGNDLFFTAEGAYHQDVETGYLVVVPGGELNSILSSLVSDADGAVSVDIARSWDGNDGWSNQLNLLADANEGRLLGWSLIQQPQ